MIVAKFPALLTLNSTPISVTERRDAETWYISHVRHLVFQEYAETTKEQWGQYDILCAKHEMGMEAEPARSVPEKRKSSALKSKMISKNTYIVTVPIAEK